MPKLRRRASLSPAERYADLLQALWREVRQFSVPGLGAVFRKELSDQLGSRRFAILFALILLAGTSSVYVAAQSIRDELAGSSSVQEHAFLLLFTASSASTPLPSFITFLGFLGPLVGIALAFDSINQEQNRGTLSRLLSQPIFRDSVINGKFLAALATVAAMLVSIVVMVSALGVLRLGIIPRGEELVRLLVFLIVGVVYVAFWLALATALSVYLRQPATAALAGIAAWIFFTFFVQMIVDTIANAIINVVDIPDVDALIRLENLRLTLSRISPNTLFQEASIAIVLPTLRSLRGLLPFEYRGLLPNPLPLDQSLLMIWPQVVGLLAFTSFCFAAAYAKFMRQEIRSL